MTRVLIVPTVEQVSHGEGGIHTLVRKHYEMLPDYGIECVLPDQEYDVLAIHAGLSTEVDTRKAIIAHTHGLYWTADYVTGEHWQHIGNLNVLESVKHACIVTCPSPWVAKTFQRDMHIDPVVLPHGIDADQWHGNDEGDYVLWNKNRSTDVCDPRAVNFLAMQYPKIRFLATYANPGYTPNVKVTGVMSYAEMKKVIESCAIYLSTTKETFGIGILEAMAAGKPVLGFREGNITEFVEHGVNGYLAEADDWSDLSEGLSYCVTHRKLLGENSRHLVQQWGWEPAIEKLADVYRQAQAMYEDLHTRPKQIDASLYQVQK